MLLVDCAASCPGQVHCSSELTASAEIQRCSSECHGVHKPGSEGHKVSIEDGTSIRTNFGY